MKLPISSQSGLPGISRYTEEKYEGSFFLNEAEITGRRMGLFFVLKNQFCTDKSKFLLKKSEFC